MSTLGFDFNDARQCRQCGCTEDMACYHNDIGPCWWIPEQANEQGPICSHCVLEEQGTLEPGSVLRYWQDEADLNDELRDRQEVSDSLMIPLRN